MPRLPRTLGLLLACTATLAAALPVPDDPATVPAAAPAVASAEDDGLRLPDIDETPDVSLDPDITLVGGDAEQHDRLQVALDRFADHDLPLPDLTVRFGDEDEVCRGHHGFFDPGPTPWEVSICSELGFVFEHELAHAWERANMTNAERAEFMRLRGHDVWRGDDVDHEAKGIEGVAFIVQQGLMIPHKDDPTPERASRQDAFAFLVGAS